MIQYVELPDPDDNPLDWVEIINQCFEECGEEWFNRYGENSIKAAMVVCGEIAAAYVDEYAAEWLAKAAEARRAPAQGT